MTQWSSLFLRIVKRKKNYKPPLLTSFGVFNIYIHFKCYNITHSAQIVCRTEPTIIRITTCKIVWYIFLFSQSISMLKFHSVCTRWRTIDHWRVANSYKLWRIFQSMKPNLLFKIRNTRLSLFIIQYCGIF